ncbi:MULTISPECIES: flagellar biosynthesis protein FlhB [Yersinia]|uniref:Flagellar biosynthetic protein FlhB n=1 Tax=Yersinia bercovieri TaxID=634 RepID=A0A2G4U6U4_YERBE|nr:MULTISPECIES: flagellar biosynthesis protein FlhB [Yersinia]MDN0101563.1 flagellar biosynthesis protein FlhB [Yersinia bercovieri]PHZ28944.1 flagellar type III secretion system protein FlhB [Yersinia bercovieri]QDW32098.1 flagellar type III secretion system protein FlhB [Yersinia sp. KBS0713]CFQ36206.1 flagellar biosynthesis protein FlhB [Yersinia bercovieri]CNF28496.1 flagellar biosynthesis protein FlhB [Yersinia bercovieri]
MSEESDVEKTEEPTPQRRSKAREDGQIPRSKELTSILMLLAGWSLILIGGNHVAGKLVQLLHNGLMFDRLIVLDTDVMLIRVYELFKMAIFSVLPILLGLFVTGIASPMLLGGLNLSGKSLKVDLKRLNPLSGLKRMFSTQMVSELLKSILKVMLVGSACAIFILGNKAHMIQLIYEPINIALKDARTIISGCLLMVILALIPLVGYDVFYQIMSNLKKLRMSRQEIRDEFKQQEGDPHLKGRIKQLQRLAASQRMMSDIPNADVIVNNPTHYSIALSYKEGGMLAPTMLAKGAGEVALRIREEALKHRIPMLEAPPLARALYRHCEIGEQIPTELYGAVAEVLAWVYSIKRWRKGNGIRPKKPENLPVPAALDFAQESKE